MKRDKQKNRMKERIENETKQKKEPMAACSCDSGHDGIVKPLRLGCTANYDKRGQSHPQRALAGVQ